MEFYLHFTSKKTVYIAQLIPENDFETLGLPKPFWKDRINKIFVDACHKKIIPHSFKDIKVQRIL